MGCNVQSIGMDALVMEEIYVGSGCSSVCYGILGFVFPEQQFHKSD